MNKFTFYNPTKIYFGENAIENLEKELNKYGKNILFTYGGGSIKKNGIYDAVISILEKADKNIFELDGIMPNPRLEKVYEGIKICKDNNIDFILAVGGGSVIDCSKAIALGSKTEKDAWETFYCNKEQAKDATPLGTILTMSATGSEMNGGSVITNWETNEKFNFTTPYAFPKFSILDPTYTYSLPKNQTAYGGVDILAHIFEVYFSYPDESNLSDNLCEAVIKTVIENLEISLENPQDYRARANLMWSSTMALNGIMRLGKEENWMSHMIEHAVSGMYDIAHGAGLAIILPNVMKYEYKIGIKKYKQYAINIWKVSVEGKTDEEIALEGINKTQEYFKRIGAPITLSEVGVVPEDLDKFVDNMDKKCKGWGSYKKIYDEDIKAILVSAL